MLESCHPEITSLGIIPHFGCLRNCPYCYEHRRGHVYGSALRRTTFIEAIIDTIVKLPNLREVLVDVNDRNLDQQTEDILSFIVRKVSPDIPVVITCTSRALSHLIHTINITCHVGIRFNVSIHDTEDLEGAESIGFSKIDNLCVLHGYMPSKMKYDKKYPTKYNSTYVMIDKFSGLWSNIVRNKGPDAVEFMDEFINKDWISVDNCATSVIVGAKCPASTQVNLYRDGSMRRCPYIVEAESESSWKNNKFDSCYLINGVPEKKRRISGIMSGIS